MTPKIRGKKVTSAQIQEIEVAAGLTLPLSFANFLTTQGCGVPTPGSIRLPEKYKTRFVPTGHLRVDKLVPPTKQRLGRTEVTSIRTFLAFAVQDDYFFLLELTSASEQGAYFWARHPAESLDEAFARTDKSIGMVSYIVRIADDFEQFVQSFEDTPFDARKAGD